VVTLLVSALCALWNGLLVAYGKIQPMVGTLILMIAGRGIAQLITNGIRIQIFYEPYAFIGNGWLVLPFPVYIVIAVFTLLWLLTRLTSIGLFIESVGVNARSSFFSGIDEKKIKLLAYTLCGLFAEWRACWLAPISKTSDANNIGWALELDAILAVVIGGTLMTGGRFFAAGQRHRRAGDAGHNHFHVCNRRARQRGARYQGCGRDPGAAAVLGTGQGPAG